MLGIVVGIFGIYWLFVAFVLLPESRVQEPGATRLGMALTNQPSAGGTSPAGTTSPPSAAAPPQGLASGLRDALATTDERLTGSRGTFGDMFGAVNALFTGLAFACVFYTILQQQEDLRLQREDLRLQRSELKASREIAIVAALVQARTTFVTSQVAAIQREGLTQEVRADLAQRIKGQLAEIEEQIPLLEQELERLRRTEASAASLHTGATPA